MHKRTSVRAIGAKIVLRINNYGLVYIRKCLGVANKWPSYIIDVLKQQLPTGQQLDVFISCLALLCYM